MPTLIEIAGGAPPFGPGIAASVVAATWFHLVTSLASVPTGGAADALEDAQRAQKGTDCDHADRDGSTSLGTHRETGEFSGVDEVVL